MAHLTYSTPQIEIEITDKVIGGTILKRKATLHTMIYNQASKALSLSWVVKYFADDSGDYGAAINVPGIATYSQESIADNRTVVDVATGTILEPEDEILDVDGERTGTWPGVDDTMGQYDWFYMMAETNPLMVHELISAYGMNANWDE